MADAFYRYRTVQYDTGRDGQFLNDDYWSRNSRSTSRKGTCNNPSSALFLRQSALITPSDRRSVAGTNVPHKQHNGNLSRWKKLSGRAPREPGEKWPVCYREITEEGVLPTERYFGMTVLSFSPSQASPLERQRLDAFSASARAKDVLQVKLCGRGNLQLDTLSVIRHAYGLSASIATDAACAPWCTPGFAGFLEKGSRVKGEPTNERSIRTAPVCATASAMAAGEVPRLGQSL
jgi:hypothetical protein